MNKMMLLCIIILGLLMSGCFWGPKRYIYRMEYDETKIEPNKLYDKFSVFLRAKKFRYNGKFDYHNQIGYTWVDENFHLKRERINVVIVIGPGEKYVQVICFYRDREDFINECKHFFVMRNIPMEYTRKEQVIPFFSY